MNNNVDLFQEGIDIGAIMACKEKLFDLQVELYAKRETIIVTVEQMGFSKDKAREIVKIAEEKNNTEIAETYKDLNIEAVVSKGVRKMLGDNGLLNAFASL